MVEDREVVHAEIRDDVHVALEESEVHPDGIVVVHATELAAPHDLGHLADGAGVDEGVVDEEHPLAPLRTVDELLRLERGLAHRLLQPQVLARLESRHAELEMGADWRRDGDRVDRGIAQELVEVGRHVQCGEPALYARQLGAVEIRHRCHLGPPCLGEVPNQVRTPVPVADDADPDHVVPLLLVSPITRAGTPATIAWAGTSRVTTAPAPTSAPSPMVTPPRIVALLPMEARALTSVLTTCQSASVWSSPSAVTAVG